MKIMQLHAENYKRLGVVEITPEGHLVTIGGKNGTGKSSVLDSIYVALKGRAVAPPQPIRKGEEKCTIRLDLGDLVITRNFHQKEGLNFTDTLKVESADGLRYGKPQETLNALLGEVGFDPFEFVNKKPKEQAAQLLEMVPLAIDLDEFASADASDILRRRDANREVKRLEAQVEGIPAEDLPDDVPDRDKLTDQLSTAADTNSGIERERVRREQLKESAQLARNSGDSLDESAKEKRAEAARLIEQAQDLEELADGHRERAAGIDKEYEALPPIDEPVDTAKIREQLTEADTIMAAVERQKRRKALLDDLENVRLEAKGFDEAIATRARERNEALAGAEMPVEGLGFAIDEEGNATLTYEGLPFDRDQISTAVQLRVSTAIGMAANPQLRVLRIADGSLLDEDSMKLLADMAEAEDFQLWVEVVGEGGVGIIMEDGHIRGVEQPADDQGEQAAEEAEPAAEEKPAAHKTDNDGKLL